jgi:hypothetical protein
MLFDICNSTMSDMDRVRYYAVNGSEKFRKTEVDYFGFLEIHIYVCMSLHVEQRR